MVGTTFIPQSALRFVSPNRNLSGSMGDHSFLLHRGTCNLSLFLIAGTSWISSPSEYLKVTAIRPVEILARPANASDSRIDTATHQDNCSRSDVVSHGPQCISAKLQNDESWPWAAGTLGFLIPRRCAIKRLLACHAAFSVSRAHFTGSGPIRARLPPIGSPGSLKACVSGLPLSTRV